MAYPVILERSGCSIAIGCLTYLLAGCILVPTLATVTVVPLAVLCETYGTPRTVAAVVLWSVGLVVAGGVGFWLLRDFRRRAVLRYYVYEDRLVVAGVGKKKIVRFNHVAAVRLIPTGKDFICRLKLRGGQSLTLDRDIAPYSRLSREFLKTLTSALAMRAMRRLKRGGSMEVRESCSMARFRVAAGVCLVVLESLAFLTLPLIPFGMRSVPLGRLWIRRGMMGATGGFVMSHDGVGAIDGEADNKRVWSEVTLCRNDSVGVILALGPAVQLAATPYAENFLVASLLVRYYLQGGAESGDATPIAAD